MNYRYLVDLYVRPALDVRIPFLAKILISLSFFKFRSFLNLSVFAILNKLYLRWQHSERFTVSIVYCRFVVVLAVVRQHVVIVAIVTRIVEVLQLVNVVEILVAVD